MAVAEPGFLAVNGLSFGVSIRGDLPATGCGGLGRLALTSSGRFYGSQEDLNKLKFEAETRKEFFRSALSKLDQAAYFAQSRKVR